MRFIGPSKGILYKWEIQGNLLRFDNFMAFSTPTFLQVWQLPDSWSQGLQTCHISVFTVSNKSHYLMRSAHYCHPPSSCPQRSITFNGLARQLIKGASNWLYWQYVITPCAHTRTQPHTKHTHTHRHTYTHTHAGSHTYKKIHTAKHKNTPDIHLKACTQPRTKTYTHTQERGHTHTHTCTQPHKHRHESLCADTHKNTHSHTCIQPHSHKHTHTCTQPHTLTLKVILMGCLYAKCNKIWNNSAWI